MDCDDHFLTTEESASSTLRNKMEFISVCDANSRDSGFDDIPQETLSEEGFLEEFVEINYSEVSQLPTSFNNLIEKPIISATLQQNASFEINKSLEELVSPLKKKICQRSEEDSGFSIRRKKMVRKTKIEEYGSSVSQKGNSQLFSSEEVIKSAIQKSFESELIGDFSRAFSLPLIESRHKDLKAIDGATLRKLIGGEFSENVSSYKIIDCRYPYEYNGGHITGALNIYTHAQCEKLLDDCADKVDVLIFHCEFSAERGPNLYRYLRKEDRKRNTHVYPNLCFPEIYILEGGYSKFFNEASTFCSPEEYTQMVDPKYVDELKYFRQTCKTLDSDSHTARKKYQKAMSVKKIVF